MNLTQAKQTVKAYGLQSAIYELTIMRHYESYALYEIVQRVLDNIPNEQITKAIRKGTR